MENHTDGQQTPLTEGDDYPQWIGEAPINYRDIRESVALAMADTGADRETIHDLISTVDDAVVDNEEQLEWDKQEDSSNADPPVGYLTTTPVPDNPLDQWDTVPDDAHHSTVGFFRGGYACLDAGVEIQIWQGDPTIFAIDDTEVVVGHGPAGGTDTDYTATGFVFPGEPVQNAARTEPYEVLVMDYEGDNLLDRERRVNSEYEAEQVAEQFAAEYGV